MDFLPFNPNLKPREPVELNDEIPKELEIFYQAEKEFLPEGKDFEDLTEEELETLKNRYRFAALKPGVNQTISGFGKMLF